MLFEESLHSRHNSVLPIHNNSCNHHGDTTRQVTLQLFQFQRKKTRHSVQELTQVTRAGFELESSYTVLHYILQPTISLVLLTTVISSGMGTWALTTQLDIANLAKVVMKNSTELSWGNYLKGQYQLHHQARGKDHLRREKIMKKTELSMEQQQWHLITTLTYVFSYFSYVMKICKCSNKR